MSIEVSKRCLSMVSKREIINNLFRLNVIHIYKLRYLDTCIRIHIEKKIKINENTFFIYVMSSKKVSKFLSFCFSFLISNSCLKQGVSKASKMLRGSLSLVVPWGEAGLFFVVPVVGWGL